MVIGRTFTQKRNPPMEASIRGVNPWAHLVMLNNMMLMLIDMMINLKMIKFEIISKHDVDVD